MYMFWTMSKLSLREVYLYFYNYIKYLKRVKQYIIILNVKPLTMTYLKRNEHQTRTKEWTTDMKLWMQYKSYDVKQSFDPTYWSLPVSVYCYVMWKCQISLSKEPSFLSFLVMDCIVDYLLYLNIMATD